MAIFISRESKRFVDISLSFEPNPISGDLTLLTNERAINNSLKNLVMFAVTEIPFRADIGSGVAGYLFDIMDPGLQSLMAQEIKRVIEYSEPRIELVDPENLDVPIEIPGYGNVSEFSKGSVIVDAKPEQNAYMVTIVYKIVGYQQVLTYNQLLEPTR